MGTANGVHHLAISTGDMKAQLTFFTEVLGAELKALYWMHGVQDTFHGFVRLNDTSYISFVQGPQTAGIEATRAICHRWPGACIVAMTTFTTREYVVAALRAGASGYVVKGASGPQLLAALRQALAGDMPLSSGVRRELVSSLVEEGLDGLPAREHGLTPREVELVHWLAHGLTNSQIARRMNVSEGSIKQYVARVSEKLGVASRTQVLVRVIQLGIVDPQALPPIST